MLIHLLVFQRIAFWGPSHGGANEAVIKMLNEIDDVKHIKKYIDKAKDKEDLLD